MEKIKFAIIGCGKIAQKHAEHIHQLGHLSAVCDIEEDKAKLLANRFQTKYYTHITHLLEDASLEFDVLSVCTPNGLHSKHTIAALNAGKHVLCEKPMALKSEDCRLMIKAAEKSHKKLFVIKQNRYNPPVAEVKKIIDQNILGEIFSIQLSCFWNRNNEYYKNSWKGSKDLDGGTLFTQFSHFIDLLYWMFGEVKNVEAFGKNFNHKNIIEFEDTGVVIIEFLNGAIGTINYTTNSYQNNMEGSLTIFGQKGTVKIGGQYLNTLEYQSIENFHIESLEESKQPNTYGTYIGSMSNHDLVYKNVIDVLQNNATISTSTLDGLKTVEIIEKIYEKINFQ